MKKKKKRKKTPTNVAFHALIGAISMRIEPSQRTNTLCDYRAARPPPPLFLAVSWQPPVASPLAERRGPDVSPAAAAVKRKNMAPVPESPLVSFVPRARQEEEEEEEENADQWLTVRMTLRREAAHREP